MRSGRHIVVPKLDGTRSARTRFLVAAVVALSLGSWLIPGLVSPVVSQAASTTTVASSTASSSTGSSSWIGIASNPQGGGYWVTSNQGQVKAFGSATAHGDMTGTTLNRPVVGIAATPNGDGYWLDASDGGIFTFGTAQFWGSTGSLRLNKPAVGMAPTRDGKGYWLVASDGGIFAFGDAAFEGSLGSTHLNEPIVGMAPTQDGRGYWLVGSDGGIFAFGDAGFEGSLGSKPPASPIVSMTPTPDNGGYWLVSQDGAVYAFGDAAHDGSLSGSAAPTTSLAAAPSGGYWVLTSDGAVHPFGDPQLGASGGQSSSATVTATAALATTPVASASPGVSLTATSTSSTVQSLSPSTGTAGGGGTVRITGTDLSGALAVYFGTNASSDFTVTSSTSITAVAPVGAGTVDVRVVMQDGTTKTNSGDQYTYSPTGQLPITAQGQNLEIAGLPTKFTGVNAYELATDSGTNAGCGDMLTTAQMDTFFASLRPNSLVRFWAFQGSMATNVNTGQLDWAPLDRVFYAAAKYHVYLIPVISAQYGSGCDGGHWQDPSWYSGGFNNVYNSATNSNGRGLDPLSYADYLTDIVSRYADSPALGMWEPMSEPEASTCPAAFQPNNCSGNQTCPNESAAAAALQYFFTTEGGQIQRLDPEHLVEAGFLGAGQCGTQGGDYQSVGASSGIDVLSVHDYYGSAPMGGDQWNGMAVRFAQARALDKPIIAGEGGILAGIGQPGCESLQQRALDISAKISAQFAAGESAYLVWNWVLDPIGPCSGNTGPSDTSLLGALASAPIG